MFRVDVTTDADDLTNQVDEACGTIVLVLQVPGRCGN